MKKQFIIFFSIAVSIFSAIHVYIYLHGAAALPDSPAVRTAFFVVFLVLASSFLAGRFLERVMFNRFTTALVWLGSLWLGAMVYFFLLSVVVDLVRLIDLIVPFLHRIADFGDPFVRLSTLCLAIGGVLAVVAYGYSNARNPRVKGLKISIEKRSPLPSMIIAVASDIHLGTVISRNRLQDIIEKINAMQADLVLLPGDVIDEDVRPVIEQNLGEMLRTIRSKYGVYSITGNHEYIGGAEKAVSYLTEHGITVLRDQCVVIADAVTVVGREDWSIRQFTKGRRMALADLMQMVDRNKPVILMDHQPFGLTEAVEQGVDLQLSGHTHHGQLWPFHWITNKVFEISWGYKKIGATHFYVSSGAGFWGPPIRTGNHPEILRIELTFPG